MCGKSEALWKEEQAALAGLWKPGWCVGAEVQKVTEIDRDDTSWWGRSYWLLPLLLHTLWEPSRHMPYGWDPRPQIPSARRL